MFRDRQTLIGLATILGGWLFVGVLAAGSLDTDFQAACGEPLDNVATYTAAALGPTVFILEAIHGEKLPLNCERFE